MKFLFISDIHGITENLDYIRGLDKKEKFDKVIVLGDLYHASSIYNHMFEINSLKVKEFLMSFSDKIICLRGNCDSDVDIKTTDFPISSNLALICVDGLDIYLTHGNEYNKDRNYKFNRKGILVYGHEHFPCIEKIDDMIYICVGSLSLPRYGSKPSYMIYENKNFIIYSVDGEVIDKIKVD